MKKKINIDQIRCLLHKYYEAATALEEELLLESFFIDTPEDKIPEDLAEDRISFLSMSDLHLNPTDIEMPLSLVERLEDIVENPPVLSKKKNRSKWIRRIVYTGIAAAVCAVITVGILNRSPLPPARESIQPVGKLTEDGYIEITDPQEAERIALEIGRLLASNSKKTDEAIFRVADAFDEYKEISKSVLK